MFISYAREDQRFVDEVLCAGLERDGIELWVDRTDIPAGSEWEPRIGLGIEASTALLFVISPDSIVSEGCLQELEHALALNKRVIGVVRREVEPAAAPDGLRRWQWIWLRDDREVAVGLPGILESLHTDLGWRDAHARLNVRSLEWDRGERDASRLLRGRDLVTAEAWYADARNHKERPTELQTEYVMASRRASTRRTRRLLISVCATLALAFVLTAFALVQRSRAVNEAHISKSRELSGSASSVLESDPELSVLLAVAGAREAPTAQAEQALRQALRASRVRARFSHPRLTSAALSPGGDHVVTVGGDGRVRFWNAATGELLKTSDGGARDLRWAAFAHDGRRVVTTGIDADVGVMSVWSVPAGKLLQRWRADDTGDTAAFTPDGRDVVTTGSFAVRAWDAATGRPGVAYNAAPLELVTAANLSGDGRRLAVSMETATADSAYVIATTDDVPRVRLPRSKDLGDAIAIDRDGSLVATSGYAERARVWDARTGRPVATLRGHADNVVHLAFSPDGQLIATASTDATARIYEARSGKPLAVLRGHGAPLRRVEFSSDGQRVVTSSSDGTARVWTLAGVSTPDPGDNASYLAAVSRDGRRAVVADGPSADVWDVESHRRLARLAHHRTEIDEVAFSPDGARVATVAAGDHAGVLWDAAAGRVISALAGAELNSSFSADGTRLVAVTAGGGATVWDGRTGAVLQTLPAREGEPFRSVAFSPSGREIATGDREAITLWDVASARRVARNPGDPTGRSRIHELAFAPDGSRLLAFGEDHQVRVLDGRTLESLVRFVGHTSLLRRAVVSPDTRRALTSSADQTARLWDLRNARELARFDGQGGPVTAVGFSPDGRFVVTAAGAGGATIWRAQTGERLTTVGPPRGAVYTAVFRADSRSLVLGGLGFDPGVYPCEDCGDLGSLLRLAERRLTRSLTRAERLRYLHQA